MSAPAGSGRVLLVANNFPPVRGGSAVVYDALARFAAGRIIVLAAQRDYVDGLPLIGWREHDRRAGYPVIRLPLLRTILHPAAPMARPLFVLRDLAIRARVAFTILRLVWRYRVQAICVGELLASAWIIDLFRHVPGLRVLVYVHGEEITTDDPYDSDGHRRRRSIAGADGVIVVSRFTETAVHDLCPSTNGWVRLIANGVDTGTFFPRPKRPDLLARYRLDGAFVFVSVCRLLEKKGVDNALRAFATIAHRLPGARFLVVGAGPFRGALEAIVEEHGMTERVAFAGEVADEDLADHYCLGDVFVMPNHALPNGDTEGFGLVFLEANACGIPVLAGRDGGSTDAVQDGVNGLVVDGASVPQIAAAMLRLAEDPGLRTRLREGADSAAAAATWSVRVRAFLDVCDDVPLVETKIPTPAHAARRG